MAEELNLPYYLLVDGGSEFKVVLFQDRVCPAIGGGGSGEGKVSECNELDCSISQSEPLSITQLMPVSSIESKITI